MSILDALRVQKANQRSIAELAALPQNEIIRMAQMGHIPADVVPVVISEKARMAKDMANMQAAAQVQGGVPTVIEQAMQQNAAAEAPPPAGGVADLPTGDMFQEQNFQSGGIVAFSGADQSFVQGPTGLNVLASELPDQEVGDPGLDKYVQQFKRLTAAAREQTPEEAAYLASVKKGTLTPEDKKQQMWLRGLQASLGILGGKSPNALQNIAEGSKEALQGYAADIKAQKAQQQTELKTAADLARAKRLEELGDITGGADLYKAAMERQQRLAIAQDNQLGQKFAKNYVALRRRAGDQRPDEALLDEGYRQFFKEYGFASGRAATQAGIAAGQQSVAATTAAGAQSVQLAGIGERAAAQAQTSVDQTLSKMGSPDALEYRRLMRENPDQAAEFRLRLVQKRAAELAAANRAPGAAPRPAPGTAPASGAPSAAAPAAAGALPDAAAQSLKPGIVTTFANGQQWTLENGQPKRVK